MKMSADIFLFVRGKLVYDHQLAKRESFICTKKRASSFDGGMQRGIDKSNRKL